MLNEQQKAAAHYSGHAKNILVLAGAGCGKTKTIVSRIEYLIRQGVEPSRILLLTFTNRASKEMMSRISSQAGSGSEYVFAGTFHRFTLSIMSQMPTAFEMSGLNIIDRDDQLSLMSIVRSKHVKKGDKALNESIPKPAELINILSFSRNTCVTPQVYMKKETYLDHDSAMICDAIFSDYRDHKSERGYVDFDDLLSRFVEMLEKKPNLTKQVASAFDHIAVDEMQDTNPVQFRILKLLISEGANLFTVGDPAQSIYGFRGAEFEHVYQFDSYFSDSEVLYLSTNYRSNQEILDLSNWILEKSPLDYKNNLTAAKGKSGILPVVHSFDDAGEEASWVANDILVNKNEDIADYKDNMILIRTAWSGRAIEAALSQRGIPYVFIGGTSLTKAAHVKDLLSLLRVCLNFNDELAWIRYLTIWPRIGSVTANKAVSAILDAGPGDTEGQLVKSFGSNDLVSAYQGVIKNIDSPGDAVEAAVSLMSKILSEKHSDWVARSSDLVLLTKVAKSYPSLRDFIDTFTLEPLTNSQIKENSDSDAVTLITVHSAKGAEAKRCYLSQSQNGMYPHIRSMGDIKKEEEERRILYVGLTRAKDEVIITRASSGNSSFYTETSPAVGECYFMESIPSSLADEKVYGWAARRAGGIGSLVDGSF